MVPPNGPAAAFSWSTWIHWKSSVASANLSTRSWVISTHSDAPISSPAAASISSNVLNTRMWAPRGRRGKEPSVSCVDIPLGYLVGSMVLGWGTACALWLPRRRGRFATVHYFSSMVINEVPMLAILLLIASTLLALGEGDLDSPGGLVSLAISLVVMAGLVVVAWRARATRPAFDQALDAGLGEGWRDQIGPHLAEGLRTE